MKSQRPFPFLVSPRMPEKVTSELRFGEAQVMFSLLHPNFTVPHVLSKMPQSV